MLIHARHCRPSWPCVHGFSLFLFVISSQMRFSFCWHVKILQETGLFGTLLVAEALPADRFVLLGLLEMRSILCLGAEDNRIKVLLLPYTP
jgi:hypothetical protein